MNQDRALRVLELTKILEQLSSYALTSLGADQCRSLTPSSDFSQVTRALAQTQEACTVVQFTGSNPLTSFADIRPWLTLAQKGAPLTPRALLDVAACLGSARVARSILLKERERENHQTPILQGIASQLTTLPSVETEIHDAILGDDEIADRASSDLNQIRRQIRSANERMRDKLSQMIRSSSFAKNLQDSLITMRGDRYCIPVKAECRGNVPGLVHDQSASGATLFIEPMVVVELGNDLKQLRVKEQQEIARILKALTDSIAPYADALVSNIALLTELDFAFAKALLSKAQNAVMPKMNHDGYVSILRGRHPLIDPDHVVPNDLWLGKDFTTLIVTGPNTGGKTVTVKTLGLFTLMAQSGLHVPAEEGTELSVFGHVYADIGDEQSIEQSLSTFSSHMTNIVSIIANMQPNDLVLFDELGAGTDPTEGATLAQSILTHLQKQGIRTMATTHYSELKAFALSTEGIENASVEFDIESLRPTYRLSIGIPGKSNAFEISRKLGLPESLINDAKTLLSKEDVRFEDVIANAEYHRQIADRERQLAIQTRMETTKLRNEAEKLRQEIEKNKQKNLLKAKEEARRVLENAKREADSILSELKAMKKKANTPEHEMQKLKKRMEAGIDELREGLAEPSQSNFTPPKSVRAGDNVEIVHLQTKGTVLSPANTRGEVQIQAGIMKMKVHISQLRMVAAPKPTVSRVMSKTKAISGASVPMEIDLRGMNLEEALDAVDRYLADAVLAGLVDVSLIHGKGTGVLRIGIQRHLRSHLNVKKYRDGMYGEGEQGVTIVTLK